MSEKTTITVAAHLELERAGMTDRAGVPHSLALAQIALDDDKPLAEVFAAPSKTYKDRVNAMLYSIVDRMPPVKDTEDGRDFGVYKLREPTGYDYIMSEREGQIEALANCFARCSGMSKTDVMGLPYHQYSHGMAWLGEELGVSMRPILPRSPLAE